MIHDQPLESEDPTIICQIDFANAFQTPNRQLGTNDCILGIALRTYDQGRVKIGDALPHLKALKNFFPYFKSMNDVASRNRFTDNEGTTHYIPGSRGGLQGDPLEMTRFCLTVHPIWGRVLGRHMKTLGANSQLQALATAHARLIHDYNCAEQQPQRDAPVAPAAAQVPQALTTLLIPPLNQPAQLRAARAHGENAENAQDEVEGPRMPDQRKITAAIMKAWAPHIAAMMMIPCTWNRPQRQNHALAPAHAEHPMHIKDGYRRAGALPPTRLHAR